MTWVVLVVNIKGGTGKSTVAEVLSKRLTSEGYDIGVFDADIDSANLASRFGTKEKVTFKGDHTIKPVEVDGMKLYSMENAFDDPAFSQSGEFMRGVIDNMAHDSEWGDLDYLVIDCPPGSSDVFEELVRSFRPNLLGSISVGIPDAVEDTVRLIKVCNHNWVPILGFIENMSGVYCHGEPVKCNEGHKITPLGEGDIQQLVGRMNGNFLGKIPLCGEQTDIPKVADDVLDNAVEAIEDADDPELPEENIGNLDFIKNVWKSIRAGIDRMNSELNIENIRDQFGVEGRDPLVMRLEMTDATGITGIFSEVVITFQQGEIEVMRPKTAKKKGLTIEAVMRISSQDLYNAIRGEKTVMRSVSGEVVSEPYSITDAVKMGDAEISGDRAINRLAVLDRILSDVVEMDEVRRMMQV